MNTFIKSGWRGLLLCCMLSGLGLLSAGVQAEPARVTLWHLPEGAIQPQAAVDTQDGVHLVYFRAEGQTGNLYYVRIAPGQTEPSAPICVNSEAGSAMATGTVRTAQIAVGKGNRVHIVWNGLGPKAANGYAVMYQAYARLNDAGTAFEAQRNLTTWATGLDGGGSVAADGEGNVYVLWHALATAKEEAGRAVFVTISRDGGKTFAREKQANPQPTGACGCCGMRAFVDRRGVLSVLYRAAGENVNRDTMLLVSRDRGQTFQEKLVDTWKVNACPMSTYALSEGGGGLRAAWETRGRVYSAVLNPDTLTVTPPVLMEGKAQKHPTVAANGSGQTLVAWTEGTGWQQGGTLAWQVVAKDGTAGAVERKAGSIPIWGLATAYVRPDGSFVLVY